MAAGLADASPRPIRVRRSPSRRRLAIIRRSSSSTISWRFAAASISPAIDGTRARIGWTSRRGRPRSARALRAVSRGPGDGRWAGRRQPRHAGARSLARTGRGTAAAGSPGRATILWPPTSRPISPTSMSRSRGRCPAPTRSRRSGNARRCSSIRSPPREASDLHRKPVLHQRQRSPAALAARLREPDGPEVVIVSPKECHGWLEQNTMGAFRDSVVPAVHRRRHAQAAAAGLSSRLTHADTCRRSFTRK